MFASLRFPSRSRSGYTAPGARKLCSMWRRKVAPPVFMTCTKKKRLSLPTALTRSSEHHRNLALGIRRGREEPVFDRVALTRHTRGDAGAVKEEVVEQQCVTRTEFGSQHR